MSSHSVRSLLQENPLTQDEEHLHVKAHSSVSSTSSPTDGSPVHCREHIHEEEEFERHSYSCKRCRRLKKKCSRAKPRCQNCIKACESCEYVPRAPRRKKSEILRGYSENQPEAVKPDMEPVALPHLRLPTAALPSVSQLTSLHSPTRQMSAFPAFDKLKPSLPPLSSFTMSIPQPSRSYIATQDTPKPLPAASLQYSLIPTMIHAPPRENILPPSPPNGFIPLPADLVVHCVRRFFDDHGKSYPFLNYRHFCELYNPLQSAFQDGDNYEVNIVVFIGYLSLSKAHQVPEDPKLKENLRVRALTDVYEHLRNETVESLKKLMYYALYTLWDFNGEASWYISGMMTRMVLSLELNRQKPYWKYQEVSSEEQEERLRLFWSCYNFDRIVSASYGRPVSLADADIDAPELTATKEDDKFLINMFNAVTRLRKVEGLIMAQVHSAARCHDNISPKEKMAVVQSLRLDIEAWYNTTSLVTISDRKVHQVPCATSWLSSVYYRLLSLIYRPSFLIPDPSPETLSLLGRCASQCIMFTYNLHMIHQLPMQWDKASRILTECSTIVYCLCHSAVELVDLKSQVNLCIQLLEHFSGSWALCDQMLGLFRKINTKLQEISSVGASDCNEHLRMFKKIGVEYCDLLMKNNYDIMFEEPLIEGIKKA